MDKVTRMIYKAKQIRNADPDYKYIAWAIVRPKGDEYEARILYYYNVTGKDKDPDVLTFKTRDEATDYVSKLAEEHGQEDVIIMNFNF